MGFLQFGFLEIRTKRNMSRFSCFALMGVYLIFILGANTAAFLLSLWHQCWPPPVLYVAVFLSWTAVEAFYLGLKQVPWLLHKIGLVVCTWYMFTLDSSTVIDDISFHRCTSHKFDSYSIASFLPIIQLRQILEQKHTLFKKSGCF